LDGVSTDVVSHHLLEPYHLIVEATRAIASQHDHVWLDITALPKRFFFPILKILLKSQGLQNLMVTYTMAEKYSDEDLHQDIQSPEYLPLYSPSTASGDDPQGLLVSVGFESSGVIQILDGHDYSPVTVMVSYPAPPPFFGRNWDFLRYAVKSVPGEHLAIKGVSVTDVSSVFDMLKNRTAEAEGITICAPFGPKPASLAMSLFVAGPGSANCAVMYTQPKYYNPKYSLGVAKDSSGPVIFAYPIRLNGAAIYS
jgi:hypothetical protein